MPLRKIAKNGERDYELAVALAHATEGAGRSTVPKVTQAEPSHGLRHDKHWPMVEVIE